MPSRSAAASLSILRSNETWQDVAVSQTETSLKVIAANDAMMNAFRDGVPDNGELFPDGSKIAKIEWSFKKNTVSPYFVNIPDTVKTVAFIEKDSNLQASCCIAANRRSGLMPRRKRLPDGRSTVWLKASARSYPKYSRPNVVLATCQFPSQSWSAMSRRIRVHRRIR
jgi:Cytochrome P460